MATKGYELYLRLVLDDKVTGKLNNILSVFTRINTQAKSLDKVLRDISGNFQRASQAATRFEKAARGVSSGNIGAVSSKASNFVSGTPIVRQRAISQSTRGEGGSWNSLHKGMMGFYMGEQILGGVASMMKPGMEYINLQNQMISRGEKLVDIQKAQAKFSEVSKNNLNISVVDAAQMYVDLRTAFASSSQALGFMPEAARLRTVMQGVHQGGNAEAAILGTIRSAEIYGRSASPELTQKFSENMAKVMLATGGRVTGTQYQQIGKVLAGGGAHISDEFLFGPMSYLIQESTSAKGGISRAGGPAAWYNAFVRQFAYGRAGKKYLGQMEEMGLAKGGKIPQEFAALAISNPFEYVTQILKPRLAAYAKKHHLKESSVLSALDYSMIGVSSTQGAQSELTQFLTKEAVIRRHSGLVAGSSVDTAMEQFRKKDPAMAMEMIQAQWVNAKLWAGLSTIQILTPPMVSFAKALGSVANVLGDHPQATNELMKISIGLGALLAGEGLIKLGTYLTGIISPFGKFVALVGALYEVVSAYQPDFKKGYSSGTIPKDMNIPGTWLVSPSKVAETFGATGRKVTDFFSEKSVAPPSREKSNVPIQITGNMIVEGKAISKYSISAMSAQMHTGIWNMGSGFDGNAIPSHPQTTPSK